MSNLEKWIRAILHEDADNLSIGSVRTLQMIKHEFERLQQQVKQLEGQQLQSQQQETKVCGYTCGCKSAEECQFNIGNAKYESKFINRHLGAIKDWREAALVGYNTQSQQQVAMQGDFSKEQVYPMPPMQDVLYHTLERLVDSVLFINRVHNLTDEEGYANTLTNAKNVLKEYAAQPKAIPLQNNINQTNNLYQIVCDKHRWGTMQYSDTSGSKKESVICLNCGALPAVQAIPLDAENYFNEHKVVTVMHEQPFISKEDFMTYAAQLHPAPDIHLGSKEPTESDIDWAKKEIKKFEVISAKVKDHTLVAEVEIEDKIQWTDELIVMYAEIHRFSSGRTSLKQFKEMIGTDWDKPLRKTAKELLKEWDIN